MAAAVPASARDPVAEAAQKALDCGAPENTVARILTAVLDGRLAREDGAWLLDLLVRACDEGLPTILLAQKAEEGLSKSVPGGVLRHALERRWEALRFARGLTAAGNQANPPPADMLMALVEGFEIGLNETAMTDLVQHHPHAPADMLATAVRCWAYLERVGMPAAESLRVVEAGLALGALTPSWLQLPPLAGLALGKGFAARTIADAALDALQQGGQPQDVAVRFGLTARRLDAPPSPGR